MALQKGGKPGNEQDEIWLRESSELDSEFLMTLHGYRDSHPFCIEALKAQVQRTIDAGKLAGQEVDRSKWAALLK
jgi:hypothetical protein